MYPVQSQNYQAGADARFAKAKRHSGRVRLLRRAVPAVVVAAMATIVIASVFNPFRILSKLPVDFGGLAVQGTRITMESPHLSGFTTDQRPYELWAKSATQDVADPNNVELHELRAKVQMEDKTGVTMDARNGLFDSKTQLLDLKDDIFLQSTTGYEARLTQASVDLGAGNVSSDEPVAVKLLNGTVRPAYGEVDKTSPWFGKPAFEIRYAPDEARKLMTEAGYSKSKPMTARISIQASGTTQTVNEAIHYAVPVPTIAASLFARFSSRQENSFGLRVLAALRNEFGGHAVKKA